ncbi:MAG: hypothetical protein R2909_01790 [Gemmatimonadales bacterium]
MNQPTPRDPTTETSPAPDSPERRRYQVPHRHGRAATPRVCPDCAGPLAAAEGCLSCVHCGWARCG